MQFFIPMCHGEQNISFNYSFLETECLKLIVPLGLNSILVDFFGVLTYFKDNLNTCSKKYLESQNSQIYAFFIVI